jgi:hypothetical protein
MTGFLGTKAPATSDVALLLEIAIILILFVSRFRFARGKRFVRHGYAMTSALVLHFITILLVMVPSFVDVFVPSFGDFPAWIVIIVLIHIPAGIIAWVVGLFLVVTWRFRPEQEMACSKWRRFMKPLFWLWVFALILGIALYASYSLV